MWRKMTGAFTLYVALEALISGADAQTLASNVVKMPLPSAWTMTLGCFVLAFLFYRLFSA
jgi:hypothetical protein